MGKITEKDELKLRMMCTDTISTFNDKEIHEMSTQEQKDIIHKVIDKLGNKDMKDIIEFIIENYYDEYKYDDKSCEQCGHVFEEYSLTIDK